MRPRRGGQAFRIQASVLSAHRLGLVLLTKRRPDLIDPEMLREVMFVVMIRHNSHLSSFTRPTPWVPRYWLYEVDARWCLHDCPFVVPPLARAKGQRRDQRGLVGPAGHTVRGVPLDMLPNIGGQATERARKGRHRGGETVGRNRGCPAFDLGGDGMPWSMDARSLSASPPAGGSSHRAEPRILVRRAPPLARASGPRRP